MLSIHTALSHHLIYHVVMLLKLNPRRLPSIRTPHFVWPIAEICFLDKLAQSRFTCPQNSLSSICNLQFAEYIRDMIADCLQAEHKLPGDFLIAATLRNQCENLNLTFREFREDLGWCGGSDIGEETD